MRIWKIFFVFTIFFAFLIGYVFFEAGYLLSGSKSKKIEVYISEGSSATDVSNMLERDGVVRNARILSAYLNYKRVADRLKVGHYAFPKGANISEVKNILLEGPLIKSKWITIPEGFSLKRIAERIEGKGKLKEDDFLELASSPKNFGYDFLAVGIETLEGYLFPQTYKIELDTTNEQFIEMMLNEFKVQLQTIDLDKMKAMKISMHQLITVASLIERETKIPAERKLVASVIYNRLANGMPLQIDATVQYTLPEWKDRLLYSDLEVDSPYNTYRNKGLPPGPICNPGMESIKAALHPAETSYLYYVLKDDLGNHHFASTYKEFLEAKKKRNK